jgi:predicted  nucleic acid-binding Zn-ribbon protein
LPNFTEEPIMNPMSQISNLHRLQKNDTQIDQTNLRIRQISEIISSDQSVQIAGNTLDDANKNAEVARKKLKGLEDDLKSLQIKIEIDEASLYGGKIINPKELKSLQEEIISIKKRMGTLEDKILDVMEQTETIENSQKIAQDNLVRAQANFATRQAALLGEQSQLLKHLELMLSEQKAIYDSIPVENLAVYKQLRKLKRGIAVSSCEDGACNACGSSLRPEEIQTAHSPEQITYCSSCGRILYAG